VAPLAIRHNHLFLGDRDVDAGFFFKKTEKENGAF
jgi:hypothetical protein